MKQLSREPSRKNSSRSCQFDTTILRRPAWFTIVPWACRTEHESSSERVHSYPPRVEPAFARRCHFLDELLAGKTGLGFRLMRSSTAMTSREDHVQPMGD